MRSDLKLYPAMKDSGVAWLGEVPNHWDVRRLRNIADMRVSNVDKHSKDGELPVRLCNYVDAYKHDRIVPNMPFMRATATREEIERFRLAVGDVLITKDSEGWNDIGVPALVAETADDLVCAYHLALLRPRRDIVAGDYLFRALQSKAVACQFHVEANGVTRYGLSHGAIKAVWLPVPPPDEQVAIVRFLDHADRKIRRAIRAKQKLVKLLEEEKQAIIHRAVTRGLDPNVRLKSSGVEWLGDVPEHWQIGQVRSIAHVVRGGSPRPAGSPLYFHGDALPWITVGEVTHASGNHVTATGTRLTWAGVARSRTIEPGTLLLTNSGATLGIPRISAVQGCINDGVAAFLNLHSRINKEFLLYYLASQTVHLKAWVDLGAQPNLNTQIIGGWPVPIPPSDEQQAIADYISSHAKALDEATKYVLAEVSALREYRTRLIADVVTGKLDVRDAAARLPDEAPDADDGDEADAEAADEATDSEVDPDAGAEADSEAV